MKQQAMSQFRNLVFKGGGVKGLAYLGALSVLEEEGVTDGVRRLCGTSSGAVVAAHVALGGKAGQLRSEMSRELLSGMLDGSAWPVRDFTRLIRDFGWFRGKRLSIWLKRHFEELSGVHNLTFAKLGQLARENPERFKDLAIIATNVTHQCPHVFSPANTPDALVAEAIRASISIPFLFSATRLRSGELCVDGGLTWNYPINFYDDSSWLSRKDDAGLYAVLDHPAEKNKVRFYNKETLGLMVETRSTVKSRTENLGGRHGDIESFPSYLKAMLGLMTDVTTSNFLNLPDWQRTIFIEAHGVRATDFNLSEDVLERLIKSGEQATRQYIAWFRSRDSRPLNRIDASEPSQG
ncbi:patatin-like phospholipase family protein [Fundidesulfovibrio terrae]|uniref:patatin-like phospholipase family protein n=1 Tax=Fundidesulfovibrio terrae TaxID=2922866 RepID=UPI001FAFE187|nr:patatin-like phospholipase family protein [Fundidesulfovibrio terrae]